MTRENRSQMPAATRPESHRRRAGGILARVAALVGALVPVAGLLLVGSLTLAGCEDAAACEATCEQITSCGLSTPCDCDDGPFVSTDCGNEDALEDRLIQCNAITDCQSFAACLEGVPACEAAE